MAIKRKNKTTSSKPSKDEVFGKIRESQERLVAALMGAWETAPDDPKIKKQLSDAMEKAVKLRDRVYGEILNEAAPDLRESYEKLKQILRQEGKLSG